MTHTAPPQDEIEHQAFVDAKRRKRMEMVDAYPPDVRACIHEYGLNIVYTCLNLGVTKGRHIRAIVDTVLNEMSPTRGTWSGQGRRIPLNAPGAFDREAGHEQ